METDSLVPIENAINGIEKDQDREEAAADLRKVREALKEIAESQQAHLQEYIRDAEKIEE